jgi:hypothetical protein
MIDDSHSKTSIRDTRATTKPQQQSDPCHRRFRQLWRRLIPSQHASREPLVATTVSTVWSEISRQICSIIHDRQANTDCVGPLGGIGSTQVDQHSADWADRPPRSASKPTGPRRHPDRTSGRAKTAKPDEQNASEQPVHGTYDDDLHMIVLYGRTEVFSSYSGQIWSMISGSVIVGKAVATVSFNSGRSSMRR